MSLDALLTRLESRAVTPVTADALPDVTPKPAPIKTCTPVTPVTAAHAITVSNLLSDPVAEALNALAQSETTLRKEVIGNATLYLGDCLEILPTLPKVDAVITDPPYGTQNLAGGYGRRQNWDIGDGLGRVIQNDEDLGAITVAFPMLLERIDNGWMMVFYAARRTPLFVAATAGGEWFGSVVWDKCAPGLGYHIRYAHEDVAVFKIGTPERAKQPLLSIIRCATDSENHPHAKPPLVLNPLVAWAASHGGIVLDPYMGSGSTGVACMNLGRKFIGVEIEKKYFDIACERIENAQRQERLCA